MMKLSLRKNQKGTTLLEVMISGLILSIGVLGLAPMFVVSVTGNIVARDNTFVSGLIKEKIEYYEALDPLPALPFSENDYIKWQSGSPTNGSDIGMDTTASSSDQDVFTRKVILEDNTTESLIPAGLVQITVAVSWTDRQNLSRSSSSRTYIIQKSSSSSSTTTS